ncbi:MCP four helix bundle domain-containing protein [Pseudomonas fragariae (ex Marin et al. 2024)]|uniref:MCP four helix bundle domain-containing protein n=1 Tax=Pseudomonas fragariae (ex Marin et al. 2024) TaxID=3080056 RepID=UPI003F7A6481
MKNLSITLKIALSFSVVTILLIILGIFSYTQLNHLRNAGLELEQECAASTRSLTVLQIDLLHARLKASECLLTPT